MDGSDIFKVIGGATGAIAIYTFVSARKKRLKAVVEAWPQRLVKTVKSEGAHGAVETSYSLMETFSAPVEASSVAVMSSVREATRLGVLIVFSSLKNRNAGGASSPAQQT